MVVDDSSNSYILLKVSLAKPQSDSFLISRLGESNQK